MKSREFVQNHQQNPRQVITIIHSRLIERHTRAWSSGAQNLIDRHGYHHAQKLNWGVLEEDGLVLQLLLSVEGWTCLTRTAGLTWARSACLLEAPTKANYLTLSISVFPVLISVNLASDLALALLSEHTIHNSWFFIVHWLTMDGLDLRFLSCRYFDLASICSHSV